MMKKIVLLITVCIPLLGRSQNVSSVHAYELLGAYTGYGYAVNVGYVNYFSDRFLGRLNFFYSQEQKTATETLYHQVYGVDLYVGYTIKYFRTIETYVNLLGGLTISMEQGNFTGSPTDYKGLKHGGMVGFEAEKYLNTNFSIMACFNQRYLLNPTDQWGSLRWYAQVGIRYHLANLNREE